MTKPLTYQVIKMEVPIADLFSDKHKETLVKALGEIKNVDQLRTIVYTPVHVLNKKELKNKPGNLYDAYEVTIISDYHLIYGILDKSLPTGLTGTSEEKNLIIAESLIDNIYTQYSEIINYH